MDAAKEKLHLGGAPVAEECRSKIAYVPREEWSPIQRSTCFTIIINSRQILHQMPLQRFASWMSVGKKNFPAVYYEVRVCNGYNERVCLRRFSQFKWLLDELMLRMSLPQMNDSITNVIVPQCGGSGFEMFFPRGRPLGLFQTTDEKEEFHETRQKDLERFCREVLMDKCASAHPSVVAFFELDSLLMTNSNVYVPNLDDQENVKRRSFPFDVIVVTSPDASAAKAALIGPLQDVAKYLDENETKFKGFPSQNISTDRAAEHRRKAFPESRFSSLRFEDIDNEGHEECNYLLSESGVLILSSTDPFGARCGSGGGTIAAVAHAEDMYKKLRLNRSDEEDSFPSVLIIHAGGDSSRCPTQMTLGKAWTSLPICRKNALSHKVEISSPTLMLLDIIQSFMRDLPKGSIVVAAGDCLLSLGEEHGLKPPCVSDYDERGGGVVLGLGVPAPLKTAKNHGVFIVKDYAQNSGSDEETVTTRLVSKFMQKATLTVLKEATTDNMTGNLAGRAWIDTGTVIFLPRAALTLRLLGGMTAGANSIETSSVPPILRICTKEGIQILYREHIAQIAKSNECRTDISTYAKARALPIDLYSHIMLALATKDDEMGSSTHLPFKKDNYIRKMKSSLKVVSGEEEDRMLSDLYDILSGIFFKVFCVPRGQFCHLGTTRELLELQCYGVCNVDCTSSAVGTPEISEVKDTEQKCRDFGTSCHLISHAVTFLPRSGVEVHSTSVAVNTIFEKSDAVLPSTVGSHCVLEHCMFQSPLTLQLRVGSKCLLSGLRGCFITNECHENQLVIADDMVLQQTILKPTWKSMMGHATASRDCPGNQHFVFTVMCSKDPIKSAVSVYGMSFERFFKITGLTADDIWPSENELPFVKRNLWNAFLHPVVANGADGIPIDYVFRWISTIMMDSSENTWMHPNIEQWRRMTRLSLEQVRAVADAYEEHTYRHRLEQIIRDTLEEHFDRCRILLLGNLDEECDTSPFVSAFLGGDSLPLAKFINVLVETIQSSVDCEEYSVAARCFNVFAGVLAVISYRLEASMDSSLAAGTMGDIPSEIRLDLMMSIEHLSREDIHENDRETRRVSSLTRRKQVCSAVTTLVNSLLESATKWHPPLPWAIVLRCVPTMRDCVYYLERTAAALTELCVCSSTKISTSRFRLPSCPNCWVIASAPGRVDIAGGWSDTPPICYEHGGAVVNLAVTVDGRRPLSARCRRTSELGCLLVTEQRCLESGRLVSTDRVRMETIEDLRDFRNPSSSAALLKAALIALGVVPLNELSQAHSLKNKIQPYIDSFFQIKCSDRDRCGLELISTSLLPRGSGMGGSSILAGCVLAALCGCAGLKIVAESEENSIGEAIPSTFALNLINAVLVVEQLMTTGGGWQDQVGGLLPGLKVGRTQRNCIPMKLKIEDVPLSETVREKLNERLVLAFTGTQRLAKNLLGNVLRRWAQRTPEVVAAMDRLCKGAESAVTAGMDGNIDELGRIMSEYWELKKVMVGKSDSGVDYGGEPQSVRDLLDVMAKRGEICGGTLLGAGGGGYLVLLSQCGRKGTDMKQVAKDLGVNSADFSWHKCSVCCEGLQVIYLKEASDREEDDFCLWWHNPAATVKETAAQG